MKNIPFVIFANIALMTIIIFELIRSWDQLFSDNSIFAVFFGILIPILSIVASIVYINKNKL